MLTARGFGLLGGAGLVWLAGRIVGVDELYALAVAAAATVLLSLAAVRVGGGAVAVRRRVGTDRLAFGRRADVVVEVRNDARLPTPTLLVTDAVPPPLVAQPPRWSLAGLAPGATTSHRYGVEGAQRGRYALGPCELTMTDRFGLASRTRRTTATDEVVVYPRIEQLIESFAAPVRRGSADGDSHRMLNLGDEFHTMREYVQGDDLRRVHWPSTAHRQKLMIRQHEQPWHARATVLLDTRAGAHVGHGERATLEAAISAAASVVWHLAEHRFVLRLATEADTELPAVDSWAALLERLAVLAPSTVPNLVGAGERLRRGAGEGLLVACVAPPPGADPVADAPDTRALLQAGRSFSSRVAIVVCADATAARADHLAGLLRAAGWRVATLPAGTPLAEVWPRLAGRAGRPMSVPAT